MTYFVCMGDSFNSLRSDIATACLFIRKHIANEMELRFSFGLQVFGMVLNNMSLVLIWVFFFKAFGEVNRWSVAETVALQGFIALVFGIAFGFFEGVWALPRRVHYGTFDSVLLAPMGLYFRILSDKVRPSAFGDMVFGIILLVIYCVMTHPTIIQFVLLIGMIVPATLILINVSLASTLLAFVVPDAEAIAESVFEIFFSPSLYPSSLYSGTLRFVFIFGIPSLAIGGLPVEVVRDVKFEWFLVVWGLAIFWALLANFLLRKAVRRYESGNLIGSRSA